jgi:O-acetylserine/cysteine efflux transporter
MRPVHLFSIVIIMVLFGSAYPIGKLGVDHFPPFQFAAMRSVVLVLALLPLWRLALPRRELVWPLAGFCLCMGTGVYATMYTALHMANTVSPIVIGTQMGVPFAVILSGIFLGERVRPITWLAILTAFSGILLIAVEPALLEDIPALIAITVSALFYALATLFARTLRSMPVFTMNGWMALTAIPLLGAMSLLLESGQWQAVTSAGVKEWGVLVHSAIAISLLAHVWMFSLYRHYPVAHVIPYYVLMPVFGILLSLVIFLEVPSLQTLLGGAVVIAGTWWVNRTTLDQPHAGQSAPEPSPVTEADVVWSEDAEPEPGSEVGTNESTRGP